VHWAARQAAHSDTRFLRNQWIGGELAGGLFAAGGGAVVGCVFCPSGFAEGPEIGGRRVYP